MSRLSVTRALPDRRQGLRAKVAFRDRFAEGNGGEFKLYVTLGIDPADGKSGEIFVRSGGIAGKNSLLHRMLDVEAILCSLLLQRGMTLDALAAAIGPDIPLAEAVKLAIEMQKDIDAWPPGAARASFNPRRTSAMDTTGQLRMLVADRLQTDEARVTATARLEDLGADSLGLIEILMDAEDALDIHFDDHELLAAGITFGDFCRKIEAKLAEKENAPPPRAAGAAEPEAGEA